MKELTLNRGGGILKLRQFFHTNKWKNELSTGGWDFKIETFVVPHKAQNRKCMEHYHYISAQTDPIDYSSASHTFRSEGIFCVQKP